MTSGSPDWASVLSLCVSAGLAVIVFYDRFKANNPATTYAMRSDNSLGNEIIIANATPVPQMLLSWELYWGRETLMGFRPNEFVGMTDEGYSTVTIQPYGWYTLTFAGEKHFDAINRRDGSALYIVLNLIGRRSGVRLRVYPDRTSPLDRLSWAWRRWRHRRTAKA